MRQVRQVRQGCAKGWACLRQMCAIAANNRAANSELKPKLGHSRLGCSRGQSRAGLGRTGVSIRTCPELILTDINAKWRHHLKRINTARQRIWIWIRMLCYMSAMYTYMSCGVCLDCHRAGGSSRASIIFIKIANGSCSE